MVIREDINEVYRMGAEIGKITYVRTAVKLLRP